jgi:hypothetical protein
VEKAELAEEILLLRRRECDLQVASNRSAELADEVCMLRREVRELNEMLAERALVPLITLIQSARAPVGPL